MIVVKNAGGLINGSNDMVFNYFPYFHLKNNSLKILSELRALDFSYNSQFKNLFLPREGQCYLVRKGRLKPLNQHASDAIKIDGMSLEEMQNIFNQKAFGLLYRGVYPSLSQMVSPQKNSGEKPCL